MGMTSDRDIFSLYKQVYFWEINRRDKIGSRVPVLLVLVLAIVSLQSYLLEKLLPLTDDGYIILSALLLSTSITSLIGAVVCIIKSWHGYEYLYLPKASTLEKRRDDIRRHLENQDIDADDRDYWLTEFTRKDLFEFYIECGSANRDANTSKSKWLYIAFNWLILSISLGIASYVLWIIKTGTWKN